MRTFLLGAAIGALILLFVFYYFLTGRLDIWSTLSEFQSGFASGVICLFLLQILFQLIFYDDSKRDTNQEVKG
jgi:hypothetical protein